MIDPANGPLVLRTAFDAAAAEVSPVEATVVLAEVPLRFRVAGPALARAILRPFAALVDETAVPVATIDLWSSAETGVPLPDEVPTGPRRFWSTADGAAALHVEGRAATALDRRTGGIVGHRSGVDDLAGHELAKPFPEILAVRLHDSGALKVHAGAVLGPTGAALVVGPTGAGKSTACLAAGLPVLGDDQVALRDGVAHGLYGSVRLAAGQVDEFASAGVVAAVPGEKSILFLDRLVRSAPVVSVLVPVAGDDVGLHRLPAAAALRAVAPSSVLGVAGGGADGFDRLADLVASVPAFRLDHGGDPSTAGRLVREAVGA